MNCREQYINVHVAFSGALPFLSDVEIGFEREAYTVDEGTDLESQVFIIKSDGFSTEEDIDIHITAISQTAELGTSAISTIVHAVHTNTL